MDWARCHDNWPQAEASAFVRARPHLWHVQRAGSGPTVLMLHGAGGATHSWAGLWPLLTPHFDVIAPDLPGHGFTKLGAMQRSGLDHMAEDLETLLKTLDAKPALIIGHSAGGALALRLAEDLTPKAVIGLNAALENFKGVAGWLFPMMAKALAMNPLTSTAFSVSATRSSTRSLITGTGSQISEEQLDRYFAAISDRGHVDGALRMMAQWSLEGLQARLPTITAPTLLLTGEKDRAVPPGTSADAAQTLPSATHQSLPELGHLAHEEDPAAVWAAVEPFLKETGLL